MNPKTEGKTNCIGRSAKNAYPDDIKDFISRHHVGTGCKELMLMLNDAFGTSYTVSQIRAYKKNHKLNSGLDCRFHKGNTPANKGKKWDEMNIPKKNQEASRRTCFKAGHSPHNRTPVGTELMKADGYVWRKIAEPNKWRQKHIIIYEKYHGIKILKGKLVTFLDGNRENFSIDNLTLISQSENQYLNKMGLRFADNDLTKSGIAIARLRVAISQVESRGK